MTKAALAFLSDGFKEAPFWRDELPDVPIPAVDLPDKVETLVIGAGFTGLVTALTMARAGREVLVVDAGEPGHGCSTRNGGQVSPEMRPTSEGLGRKLGPEAAQRILATGAAAHKFLRGFVATEKIDCDYKVCGHFIGAHSPGRLKDLEAFGAEQRLFGSQAVIVPRSEQGAFVESDDFHGGLSLPDWSSIHPGRYHRALLRLAVAAGARILPNHRVEKIDDLSDHTRVTVAGRTIRTQAVVMGTDGYADGALPWLRRRIVSVASYVLTTEPMDPALVARLYPGARMVYDTRKNVSYHRPTPDGQRILFGTVVPLQESHALASLPMARANMLRVFPDLVDVKISHAWYGMVGATFDHLPHIGSHGRIHYATGYNGTGIAMSTYLGTMLGRKLVQAPDAATALDGRSFPTMPFYTGNAWFRTPLLYLHRLQDALR